MRQKSYTVFLYSNGLPAKKQRPVRLACSQLQVLQMRHAAPDLFA